jgi:hypothetical protein
VSIRKYIFLSHIHEEKNIAILIQNKLEEEFSGFVDIFVSSDGKSIPAGTNFLKRIEEILISSSAGLFLVSNRSVKRNWINFELGAIWIRGIKDGVIPAIPICHSGITPKNLPPPLNSLNAVRASDASQLEQAFYSLQKAVGGKGKLRTDFVELSDQIKEIERRNILCSHLARVLSIFNGSDFYSLMPEWEKLDKGSMVELRKSGVGNRIFGELSVMKDFYLKDYLDVETTNIRKVSDTDGNTYNVDIHIKLPIDLILSNKDILYTYSD